MSAQRIDGRTLAGRIRDRVKNEVAVLGFTPGLGVVLVGDDPASHLYVRLKEKACADVGIRFEKTLLPADASEADALAAVRTYNERDDIDGILIQLPLPKDINETRVIAEIDPAKDADGFHPENAALLRKGTPRIVPGLAAGIMELIAATGVPLAGKSALVVANSPEFYAPLETNLADHGASPSFNAPDNPSLTDRTRNADVLIVAVGRPGTITGDMIKPGAIVIDVGTNRVGDNVVGDVDAASVEEVAGHLTPVPGGVGPMTVAMLLKNVVELARERRKK